MDEALCRTVLDCSNRPYLAHRYAPLFKPNLDGISVSGKLLRLGQRDDFLGNGLQRLPAELQYAHGF